MNSPMEAAVARSSFFGFIFGKENTFEDLDGVCVVEQPITKDKPITKTMLRILRAIVDIDR
jgi:hypothetical protein